MGKNKIKPKELHFLKSAGGIDIDGVCREANILIRTQRADKAEIITFLKHYATGGGVVQLKIDLQTYWPV